MKLVQSLLTGAILFSLAATASATIINFDFTGRLTVADGEGGVFYNGSAPFPYDGYQTPIAATLSYDTNIGITSSALNISMGDFMGSPAVIDDIITTTMSGNIINAQMQIVWQNNNMISQIQWDATGLINAINYGLQVGDKLSGNNLFRDYNHDHVYTPSELVSSLNSATPYSDELLMLNYVTSVAPQLYAPLAATRGSPGLIDGPFQGIALYMDIGSGNSMYVTSISSVPVPSALWLLGSGLLGLIGVARRKTS